MIHLGVLNQGLKTQNLEWVQVTNGYKSLRKWKKKDCFMKEN